MKVIEKKARQIVRQAYFDYKESIRYFRQNGDTTYCYRTYQAQMDLLKALFPKTTNQDALENMWDAMWRKENRD